jgi:hypothetical protein
MFSALDHRIAPSPTWIYPLLCNASLTLHNCTHLLFLCIFLLKYLSLLCNIDKNWFNVMKLKVQIWFYSLLKVTGTATKTLSKHLFLVFSSVRFNEALQSVIMPRYRHLVGWLCRIELAWTFSWRQFLRNFSLEFRFCCGEIEVGRTTGFKIGRTGPFTWADSDCKGSFIPPYLSRVWPCAFSHTLGVTFFGLPERGTSRSEAPSLYRLIHRYTDRRT